MAEVRKTCWAQIPAKNEVDLLKSWSIGDVYVSPQRRPWMFMGDTPSMFNAVAGGFVIVYRLPITKPPATALIDA